MRTQFAFTALAGFALLVAPDAFAYTLWSTPTSYLGSGEFHGPGANLENGPLFPTVIRNMMFETAVDFITPFSNNGSGEPNICAEAAAAVTPDGKLSDGSLINENVDTCAASIAGIKVLPAAISGGRYQGEQRSVTLDNGDVIMTMDFAIDLGVGEKGVARLPFYGTTGEVTVPLSVQTQMGGKGVDQAGKFASGTKLRGRIGDFNHDGWIDGTILSAGVMPLDSRFYPGQPYLIIRNFETDIPLEGRLTGDVKSLRERTAVATPSAARLVPVVDKPAVREITISKRLLYGPGPFPDQMLAAGHVHAMRFDAFMNATVPAFNNGAEEPNVSGERAQGTPVDGRLSDGTQLNEYIEMGNAVIINGQFNLVLGAVFGGPAQGASHFFLDEDYNWTIRDDIAMDPGFPEGIVKINDFTFSTGPKPVPFSIQTASQYPGGLDRVGTLKSGDITIGRLGDDDLDGKVDGVFFAMGQLPLSSAFLPGAPFVQRMEFTSTIPIAAPDAALLTVALARNCLRALAEPKPGMTIERSAAQLRACVQERSALGARQLQRAASGDCKRHCADLQHLSRELQNLAGNLTTASLAALDDLVRKLAKLQGRSLNASDAMTAHVRLTAG